MFQIVYEQLSEWPENGPLVIEAPAINTEILVSPDSARRRVNRYLSTYVSMTTYAADPILNINDKRSCWRLSIHMRLPEIGHVATLGVIDIDAMTCEIIPLSNERIRSIQDQANDIIARLTPEAA